MKHQGGQQQGDTTVTSHDLRLRLSTPGRVCLFGEHQDYLLLPVIPCAISLRVSLEGWHCAGQAVRLHLPDIGKEETFPLDTPLAYSEERDYFKSSVNVMRRAGFTFSRGLECTVRGEIPINSGTSSSTALIVTWVNFLARMSDQRVALSPAEIARIGHAAEVLEFGEPGGMMDHFSTAYGGTVMVRFHPEIVVEPLRADLGVFVLGDSGEPKDTKKILSHVKDGVLRAQSLLAAKYPDFSLHSASGPDLERYADDLTRDELELLRGTLRNRDITLEAERVLRTTPLDHEQIGALLDAHQAVLREVLRISTVKIDAMIDAAREAGALGGKINGSGGGGCMFAYAPTDPESVAGAIRRAGGRAYVVRSDAGTRAEPCGSGS